MIDWLKGRIACWRGKHARGKRIGQAPGPNHSVYVFRCPRCKAEWWKKVTERKAKETT